RAGGGRAKNRAFCPRRAGPGRSPIQRPSDEPASTKREGAGLLERDGAQPTVGEPHPALHAVVDALAARLAEDGEERASGIRRNVHVEFRGAERGNDEAGGGHAGGELLPAEVDGIGKTLDGEAAVV